MKFKRKPKVEGEPDKRKIKSVKKEQDGITFDSTLELYMYNLLKDNNIRFDLKTTYTLQEGFTYRHEVIQPMRCTPDFILLDYPIIIETKGFANELAPIRFKMLKYHFYKQGKEINILMPSNQLKCRNVIDGILNGFKLEEPLTEHAATARKNKLKKAGFVWKEGMWVSNDQLYMADWIMNIPKYEFEELLISSK